MRSTRRILPVFALAISFFSPGLGAQSASRQPMSERDFLDLLQVGTKRALLGIQFSYQQEPGSAPPRYNLKILAVQPGGPGDAAGIRTNDLVVKFDDQPLIFEDPLEIDFHFDPILPNQAVKLSVIRGSEPIELVLTAAELPPEMAQAKIRNRRTLMKAAGIETAEKLGLGAGTRLNIRREGESGRLAVELIDKHHQLSPLRLASLTVAFEDSPLFPRAREVSSGSERAFLLSYDQETTTFNLDPIPDLLTYPPQ
ncbi:MAG: PDZ domain-containing protein [Thermoanaerobaculia bacterium]|nr:PDZ domain-containing protein [Thermoanaerobaculia bacterium]